MEYSQKELLEAIQQAVSNGETELLRPHDGDRKYPSFQTYSRQFGGVKVAALRGDIDADCTERKSAIPLTETELNQFIDLIPQLDPSDQAVALAALLTGCAKSEHKYIAEEGIEHTETDSAVIFPTNSYRGSRSVSVGPLYNQFVKVFDPISTERFEQAIEFSDYPPSESLSALTLFCIFSPINFDIDRPIVRKQRYRSGPQVLHRDLRATHYLFERCRGTSQAMLKRRLGLSDYEIKNYNRFLDVDEDGWSVRIEWRD
jgi:hypothetical protein